MGQALYRKYRSKSFDQIEGQEHIINTLKNAIKNDSISHAYLLSGPKGVGKTSVARILAHEVNGLAYENDNAHLDIIEIDAASNRRIDEIRDLRDKVHTLPTSLKYKVYIIDEVHMLTKEAFNALLKTLEEPPAHVIFVLATTEIHKLPETIISRTQRFAFKPIDIDTLTYHLNQIAKKEHINIDGEALELISQHGDGSFRDSISLLDQLSSGRKNQIKADDVRLILGIAPVKLIDDILHATFMGDLKNLLDMNNQIQSGGFNAPQIAKQLSSRLRQRLQDDSATLPIQQIVKLLGALVDVPASSDPQQLLELTLLEFALEKIPTEQKNIPTGSVLIDSIASPTKSKSNSKSKNSIQKPVKINKTSSEFSLSIWPEVLDNVKKQQATLYSILKLAEPSFNDESSTLTLLFRFAFHQKRINEEKNKQFIQEVIHKICGQRIKLNVIVQKGNTKTNENLNIKTPSSTSTNNVDNLTTIFGKTEILEN